MHLRYLATVLCATVITGTASAQTHDNPFRFGTTLSGFAGGAADTEGAAPAVGLELGWEMTRRLAINGSTLWSAPGNGQHDFSVMIGPRINLTRKGPRLLFVTADAGMYRATFDALRGPLPPFYGNRLSPSERVDRGGTFDDFVASVGGGAELFISGHWAVRPEVGLMTAFGNSDVRWVTTFGGHLAYHFERHRTAE